MAHSADDLVADRYLRLLLLGYPKSGKTTMVIGSSPPPVRVILCENDSALVPAKRVTRDFTFDRARTFEQMTTAILSAKRAVKAGEVKTIVVDPLSTFAQHLLDDTMEAMRDDGRRAYPSVLKQLRQCVDQLTDIQAHVVVISHYLREGGGQVQPEDGSDPVPTEGEGVIPLLPGKARLHIAALFTNVVWFGADQKTGKRLIYTQPKGVWGPGARSFRDARTFPADVYSGKKRVGIRAFIHAMKEEAAQYDAPETATAGATEPSDSEAPKEKS